MNIKSVFRLLKPYSRMIAAIIVYAVLISILAAVMPFINQRMLDRGLLAGNIQNVINFVFLLLFMQCSDRILQYLQRRQEIRITNALGKDLKIKALSHGLKLKPHYFKEQSFYKTIGDALYDISSLMNVANNNSLIIFVILFKAIGAGIGLFLLDWRLAVFIIILLPLKAAVNILMRNRAEKLGKQLMEKNKNYNSWFSDILSGIMDIKFWNLQKQKCKEYAGHVESINKASQNLSLLMAKNTMFTSMLELLFTNALYILGAFLIAGDRLTFGGLIAFISFAAYLFTPVNAVMDLRITLKQVKPSVDGLKKYFSLQEENYSSALEPAKQLSSIEFRDVSVIFQDRVILDHISFTIHRGEKVALVGENGSGKTTILNLLLRICEPTSGEILVDGTPLQEYNIEAYRRKFSVVPQDVHLFKGSVGDNITFGNGSPHFSDPHLSFCTEAIERLEQQYETPAGSDGKKLSGGERQKIALLRALYHQSDILILDEATASYDKESEQNFDSFIRDDQQFGFYFLVTHRKGSLHSVSRILRLSNGKIIENTYQNSTSQEGLS